MTMNSTLESSTPKSKRSISPRPRTVGEEVKVFHDTSDRCSELYKKMDEKQESAACEREQQYRPTTPAEDSMFHATDPVENSSNPSPPPPYKWAQSLICLLEDIQGVNLFQRFLEQEGQSTKSLKFWFACRGMKTADLNDREGMRKLIKLLFEKQVIKISSISSATKEEIKQKLSTNVGVDDTIFDSAQAEVEAFMMKTTFPNFLRSDIYINNLDGWQNEPLEKDTVSTLDLVDLLPTIYEDSELQISSGYKVLLTRENLLQRHRISSNYRGKLKRSAHLYLKSLYRNYSSYHCKYSSFLPTSAQDSALQSLSSDAQTDDTMSLTDSSSVDYSMRNKREQKRQLKAAKQNAHQNKDTHNTFIPRTQRLPNSKFKDVTSKEARIELLKKLEKLYEKQKANEKIEERLKIFVDHDTHSKDSCISNDYYSNDSLSVYHRGPSSVGSSGPIDSCQSTRFKEQIQRFNENTGVIVFRYFTRFPVFSRSIPVFSCSKIPEIKYN